MVYDCNNQKILRTAYRGRFRNSQLVQRISLIPSNTEYLVQTTLSLLSVSVMLRQYCNPHPMPIFAQLTLLGPQSRFGDKVLIITGLQC